tara:strand:- start:419 stop:925 length:507 start_codon:yes stop_codon:yes gene_type:complete
MNGKSFDYLLMIEGIMKPILTTMIYCIKHNCVLLMRRNKEPNLGLWVGPGGKIEDGESPYDCAIRELYEETGLIANTLSLKGLITEVSPRSDWQWLIFIYVTEDFVGDLIQDDREGSLEWVELSDVMSKMLPEADKIWFDKIIDNSSDVYQAKFIYDDALNMIGIKEY